MKSQEFLRIVEEICIILKMNQPSVHKVLQFYQQFQQSQTHQYKSQIIIAACIFLVSKIDEKQLKIRDIVNICYLITSLYKLTNKRKNTEGIEYLSIDFLKDDLTNKRSDIWKQLIPDFPLDKFSELKKQILEAQQHLLRIVNFQVENTKLKEYKILIGLIEKFKLNRCLRELVIRIFNDSIFTEAKVSPKACIHFAVQFGINSELVKQQQIMPCLLQIKWWQKQMDMKQQQLLDYGITMMEYYKDIQ